MRLPFNGRGDAETAQLVRLRMASVAAQDSPRARVTAKAGGERDAGKAEGERDAAKIGGWVPRVPSGVLRVVPSAENELKLDGDTTSAVVEYAGDADTPATRAEHAGGRHARRPPGLLDEASAVTASRVVGDRGTPPGATASPAMADRLPLVVRGAWARCAPLLARCRLELGRSHVIVVVIVLVMGLTAAAVVYGVGRPRVVPVGAEMDDAGPAEDHGSDQGGTGDHTSAERPDAGTGESGSGPDAGGEPGGDGSGPGGASGGAMLMVHVAGKVANPGVISLPSGSRVVDAIEAAGGAEAGVDLTPLNLARVVSDGEQVLVGVDPPPGHADAGQPDHPPGPEAGGRVSLNTATVQQLETLPGIGPALAQRIVEWRENNGRFTSIEELHEVSGIGPSKYADIAPLVVL
ncbi:hypothetical protein G1H11_23090 [Phytoactinopolyspora alkaliphila]|uniref:Helix-hairpin-helix DNA-binding motif class 1 domain-containing protein n=1 Tax=Phytoactinopolyspora alkaliphila TaxID=1783498 RepID=A0A6N9YTB8_9ACTN|nr:helix-hairpin-helix domain-containing protein [Phytoactinopolyspora alkaliphila]NED98190.1 hypothetical protein [Phytoactinopolyspora alkaliphila]